MVLHDVPWSAYVALVSAPEGRSNRVAYDQGLMEIMVPSLPHERSGTLIGRMVETFTEEMAIDILSSASTTFQRADVKRGFEADESYYIANAAAVREKEEIDLAVDPPPDLVIEVDISRTSMSKFAIYGALGVPEIWRYDGQELHVYRRVSGHDYDVVQESIVLPQFPLRDAERPLDRRREIGETELIGTFRRLVRDHLTGT